MAIMSRGKKANAQRWDAINKQREKENAPKPEQEEKKVSKEDMAKCSKL